MSSSGAGAGAGTGKDASGVQAWTMCDLPTVRNQLNVARSCLEPLLSQLGDCGDSRGYHSLGPLTLTHESVVKSNLSLIEEALDNFTKWSKEESGDTSARYLAHCKDVSDRVGRLQDNKRALAECRRLLERHTSASSRRKFLEQLEAIAREAGVTFYAMEEDGAAPDASQPSHCLSGQTFVLDLHVDAEGAVAWVKLQRIKKDGNSVPDEEESKQEQWEQLNASIVKGLLSKDMEVALKSKFKALHLIEEAHARHPDVGVYDVLRGLEEEVEKLHADKLAMAEGQPPWKAGMGSMKRLVEGILIEYYQSLAPDYPIESAKACLQLDGVTVPAVAAGAAAAAAADRPKAAMSIHLQPSIMHKRRRPAGGGCERRQGWGGGGRCSMVTAGSLQTLGQRLAELPVPLYRMTNGVSWHTLVRPPNSTAKTEGVVVSARGQRFLFIDHSIESMGVEVHNVPVATAAEVLQALQLLRQQQVMNEVFSSCLSAATDKDEEGLKEGAHASAHDANSNGTNGADTNGFNGHDDAMDTDAVPPRVVEVTSFPPSSIMLHTPLTEGPSLDLLCIEIQVELGGDVIVKLHAPDGQEPPCTEEYATKLVETCRTIPLALSYMFQNQ